MPYPGVEVGSEQESKIESCVKDVMAQGKDKSSAIAICISSVVKGRMTPGLETVLIPFVQGVNMPKLSTAQSDVARSVQSASGKVEQRMEYPPGTYRDGNKLYVAGNPDTVVKKFPHPFKQGKDIYVAFHTGGSYGHSSESEDEVVQYLISGRSVQSAKGEPMATRSNVPVDRKTEREELPGAHWVEGIDYRGYSIEVLSVPTGTFYSRIISPTGTRHEGVSGQADVDSCLENTKPIVDDIIGRSAQRSYSQGDVFRAMASVKGVESGKEYGVVFIGANMVTVQATSWKEPPIELADYEFEQVAGDGVERATQRETAQEWFDKTVAKFAAAGIKVGAGSYVKDNEAYVASEESAPGTSGHPKYEAQFQNGKEGLNTLNRAVTPTNEEQAYAAGKDAFARGYKRETNPFKDTPSALKDAWDKGWVDASTKRAKVPVNSKSERTTTVQEGNAVPIQSLGIGDQFVFKYGEGIVYTCVENQSGGGLPFEVKNNATGLISSVVNANAPVVVRQGSRSANPLDRLARTIANAFKQFVGERAEDPSMPPEVKIKYDEGGDVLVADWGYYKKNGKWYNAHDGVWEGTKWSKPGMIGARAIGSGATFNNAEAKRIGDEGWKAALAHVPLEDCPYPYGTPENTFWSSAWLSAQNRPELGTGRAASEKYTVKEINGKWAVVDENGKVVESNGKPEIFDMKSDANGAAQFWNFGGSSTGRAIVETGLDVKHPYDKGYNSFHAKLKKTDNPYPAGSEDSDWWNQGFDAAVKESKPARAYVQRIYAALAKMRGFEIIGYNGNVIQFDSAIEMYDAAKILADMSPQENLGQFSLMFKDIDQAQQAADILNANRQRALAKVQRAQLSKAEIDAEKTKLYAEMEQLNSVPDAERTPENKAKWKAAQIRLTALDDMLDKGNYSDNLKGRSLEPIDLYFEHGKTFLLASDQGTRSVYRFNVEADAQETRLTNGIEISAERSDNPTLRVIRQAGKPTRWLAVASSAVLNRQGEIDSTKLFDSFVTECERTKKYPGLDFFHQRERIMLGQADYVARDGALYIASGEFADTPLAQAAMRTIEREPADWGLSISYLRTDNPEFVQISPDIQIPVFTRGINDFISVLPATDACDWFTAIGITRGVQMDKKVRDALLALVKDQKLVDQFAGSVDDTNREINDKRLIMRAVQVQREGAAYEEGKTAFAADPASVNPYPEGDPQNAEWQKGFDDAKAGPTETTAEPVEEQSVAPVRANVPVDAKNQRAESPEWQAVYDKAIADGKSPEEAKKLADESASQPREVLIDEPLMRTLIQRFVAEPQVQALNAQVKDMGTANVALNAELTKTRSALEAALKRLDALERTEADKQRAWQNDLPRTQSTTTIVRQRAPDAPKKERTAQDIANETLAKMPGPRMNP